ncbi:MAG: glycoside hydrolase family 2 [Proteobacteria bacterium]|nr:glycoside hydrolase family 2 [Pseudomonadota bacterium]
MVGSSLRHPFSPATVPGTVLTTLVNNKVYPEPLYGENNRPDKIPDTLCRTDWWYRTSFTVPEDYAGKTVWLNFDGINYAAEVWVNGHAIGKMKGAFIRGIFDITPYVTAGKAATLAVRVSPEPTPGETTEHTIRLGTGNNFCVTPADGPTFLCTIGWDWLPTIRDRNTGIWQKVFLSATGPAVIKDPLVTTDLPLPRTDSADIDIKATVQNVMDSPLNGELEASFDGITIRQNVSLKPGGSQQVSFDPSQFPQLHVMNPKLWWPNGFGEPNLHLLRLVLKTEGKISDAQEFNFGIRKITYTNPPSDNLAFSVNGVPIFAKGGNWGLDEALKRIPRERLEAQVKMHQLANYTMIRNWVGQSTGPDLYDLCDKYGILLWDEFFQPSGGAPMPVDFDAYMANVKDKMLRFRNHPCIAIWCARNEGNPPKNIDDAIRGLMKELEPARLYQPNSKDGRGVRSGGPYGWRTPEQYYEYPPEESFKTESGSVSIPTIESIQGMMPEKDWESINDDWAEHDLTRGAQERRPYLKTLENRYGKAVNLADFVRKGQMMNYEAFRAMYEGRLAKLFNPETGVLTWMSHPAQPSFVWQIYHYDLEPNAALFAARKACEPIHIMLNEKELKIQVVNNLPTPLKGAKASISIYNLEGTKVSEKVIPVEAAPSTATDLGPVSWPQPPLPVEFVRLELRDATGALISDNFYWRGDSSKTGDLTALEKLPPVTLDADSIFHEVGSNILTEVTLSNPSKSVALMVHLQLHRSGDGKRVLPAYYSDNYFSLVPGGKKVVTIEASKKSMEGQDPLVLIDGFNLVGVKNESSGRVSVKLNENAQVSHWPQHGMKIDYGTPQSEYQMNCGGDDVAAFKSDEGYGRGSKMSVKTPIDTSDPLSAPEAVYQSCRFRKASYLFAMKPPEPGHSYKVRLHFAELQFNAPDKRKMDVKINGKTAIKDLDVFQTAGAMNKAVVKEVHGVLPDEDGKIDIDPVSAEGRKDTPAINGIEILPE